jgi:hypothetical protein
MIYDVPEEELELFRRTGANIKDTVTTVNDDTYREIVLYCGEYQIGRLEYRNDWEHGKVVGIYRKWCVDTRVLMNVQYKFTKSKAIPEIQIETKFRKEFPQEKAKQAAEWVRLIVLWLKTAEAKKKKIMVDVEFEQ